MRRDAKREEQTGRLLAAVVLAAMLTVLCGIIHQLYHREYAETDTPNDCFAVSAATGETALPKMVCLTFDDGPSKNTVPILEILDREQVPATFFVCAQDANERYLPLVADIAAAGHQIALHSATHQYSKIYASTDAFWQDIKALRQALEDEKLILYYNAAYGKMDTVREVLCRAALVRSLTQIDGVDLVMICVDGTPLTDKKGNTYGYQQAEDFVQNTGSSINSFQEMKLTLYYADSSGEKLQKEEDTVRYNSNESKERVVVEQLMRGPSNNRLLATIPKGTKLLGVSIKDHICYLNFDEGLRNIAPGVSPETVIYSIVNSVIDGGNVSEVQISINGDSSIVYQESIKLDEPLSRNQEMIKED